MTQQQPPGDDDPIAHHLFTLVGASGASYARRLRAAVWLLKRQLHVHEVNAALDKMIARPPTPSARDRAIRARALGDTTPRSKEFMAYCAELRDGGPARRRLFITLYLPGVMPIAVEPHPLAYIGRVVEWVKTNYAAEWEAIGKEWENRLAQHTKPQKL